MNRLILEVHQVLQVCSGIVTCLKLTAPAGNTNILIKKQCDGETGLLQWCCLVTRPRCSVIALPRFQAVSYTVKSGIVFCGGFYSGGE